MSLTSHDLMTSTVVSLVTETPKNKQTKNGRVSVVLTVTASTSPSTRQSTENLEVGSLYVPVTVTLKSRSPPRRRDTRVWSPVRTTSRPLDPECYFSLTGGEVYHQHQQHTTPTFIS